MKAILKTNFSTLSREMSHPERCPLINRGSVVSIISVDRDANVCTICSHCNEIYTMSIDAMNRCLNLRFGIKEIAYEMYKIDWMRRIFADRQLNAYKNYFELADEIFDHSYTFEDYLEEYGYDGELYVCFDEFLECEYQDSEYMKWLLSPFMYEEWLNDLTPCELAQQTMERCADCASLVSENATWWCDECNKACHDIKTCPYKNSNESK